MNAKWALVGERGPELVWPYPVKTVDQKVEHPFDVIKAKHKLQRETTQAHIYARDAMLRWVLFHIARLKTNPSR